MRATANAQNAQAVQEWQGLQGATPNLDAQVAANRQLWNQGSREAAVDTSQLQDIANQGYTDADNATLQAAQNQANQSRRLSARRRCSRRRPEVRPAAVSR